MFAAGLAGMSVLASCLQPPDACAARVVRLTRIKQSFTDPDDCFVLPDPCERLTTYIEAGSHRHTRVLLLSCRAAAAVAKQPVIEQKTSYSAIQQRVQLLDARGAPWCCVVTLYQQTADTA
jgi:hypothetical protein